ncbi:Tox-REase-5 domain-containing protein [Archangium sp.]|uniref:Tox-REase-5 domain-containing protein n=1 Tax=Archangium sp. TaxID=1872627 RepID=UPI002D512CD2|nr:Tox-REase-5 domain-containing protein [Archangium sp.]HYO59438.1 Tox-REase-5 domain-containing protein [Archangium sp.]
MSPCYFQTLRSSSSAPSARSRSISLLIAVALLALTGCATGTPRGSLFPGSHRPSLTPAFYKSAQTQRPAADSVQTSVPDAVSTPDEDDDPEDDVEEEEGTSGGVAGVPEDSSRSRARYPAIGEDEPLEDRGEGQVGWPDGVGDGRPRTVPMSVDYFQGLLAQVGIPDEVLPTDGSTLSPEQALRLMGHLLEAEVTLGDFARQRMAAHLLLEVATGAGPVTRQELHARMDRFHRLRVVRPDGYLVRPVTGEAVQRAGEVWLEKDGTLRAGRYEVGPFYAVEDGQLWLVDTGLEVPRGAKPLGPYVPEDGVVLPALEGAGLALGDTVEGLYQLIFKPGETLEGMARLPGAVRVLFENAPEYWEAFRQKPRGEQVRTVSRLVSNVLLTVGSSGAGAAKSATWGEKLSRLSVPLLALTREGELVLRLVAVPGRAVAVAGQGLSVTWGLHMAKVGAGGGGNWTPPVGGPGQWVPKNERMSARSRNFQHKVTKAPAGWVYRVWRNGEKVDFDGFDFDKGILLEIKGLGYDKHFDTALKAKRYFKGAKRLVNQARRQLKVANGVPIRWHVAEPRMVAILKRLFREADIEGIDVVYTQP